MGRKIAATKGNVVPSKPSHHSAKTWENIARHSSAVFIGTFRRAWVLTKDFCNQTCKCPKGISMSICTSSFGHLLSSIAQSNKNMTKIRSKKRLQSFSVYELWKIPLSLWAVKDSRCLDVPMAVIVILHRSISFISLFSCAWACVAARKSSSGLGSSTVAMARPATIRSSKSHCFFSRKTVLLRINAKPSDQKNIKQQITVL